MGLYKLGVIMVSVVLMISDYPQIEHSVQSVGASKLLGTRFKENHHDFRDFLVKLNNCATTFIWHSISHIPNYLLANMIMVFTWFIFQDIHFI